MPHADNIRDMMEHLTLHVAPGGDDAGRGTEAAPFATIERAATKWPSACAPAPSGRSPC